jgi:hypothetical protein
LLDGYLGAGALAPADWLTATSLAHTDSLNAPSAISSLAAAGMDGASGTTTRWRRAVRTAIQYLLCHACFSVHNLH